MSAQGFLNTSPDKLTKDDLLAGLLDIDRKAKADHKTIELAVYGGSALALAYNLRTATRDLDVSIRRGIADARKYAMEVASEHGWDKNWLNDGVKGFLSAKEDLIEFTEFTNQDKDFSGGLMVFVPTPEYLFAMKCLSMRLDYDDDPQANPDVEDIKNLAKLAGITSAQQAVDILLDFYPENQVEQKTFFGIEEIFQDLSQDDSRPSEIKGPK